MIVKTFCCYYLKYTSLKLCILALYIKSALDPVHTASCDSHGATLRSYCDMS